MIHIAIQQEDFDVAAEMAQMRQATDHCGAIASFIGLVRGHDQTQPIQAISLEHYPGMAEKAIHEIALMAQARWPVQAIRVIHRVGKLHAGEQIVLVLTASAHRHAAFSACEFVMDYLKVEAPFWKKEWLNDATRWLETKASDQQAQQAWFSATADEPENKKTALRAGETS